MPDGYITEDGRQDLKRYVLETIKDWESHAQKLVAAREVARQGREPLSLMVRCWLCPFYVAWCCAPFLQLQALDWHMQGLSVTWVAMLWPVDIGGML